MNQFEEKSAQMIQDIIGHLYYFLEERGTKNNIDNERIKNNNNIKEDRIFQILTTIEKTRFWKLK